MAGATYAHHVGGKALIKISTSDAPSVLNILGYSLEGVEIQFQAYTKDIHGDQNGGSNGPPVDVLLMGQTAIIRFDLIDYQQTQLTKVLNHKVVATAGIPEQAGVLLLAGAVYLRLCIVAVNDPFNFPYCELLSDETFNLGTNETVHRMSFRALVPTIGGALYNTTIT